ncbi:prepilin-type N-terminal cleavage/methylation domain-containing protein [Vibrio cholerae]|nr:prepilin-type N-terminal cleavage/methylation domain-containing protein [Vibrio cholerae]
MFALSTFYMNKKTFNTGYPKKAKGFTLIEVLFVLALFFAFIVWVGKKSDWVTDTYRIVMMKGDVMDISTAVTEWGQGKSNLSGLSMAAITNLLPDSIGNGQGTNPWGGNYEVSAGSSPFQYVIRVRNVPPKGGARGATGYTSATYDASSQTIAINLGN